MLLQTFAASRYAFHEQGWPNVEDVHFLEHSTGEMNFSSRAHDRILADLARLDKISADNVLEAVQYRPLDRKLFMLLSGGVAKTQ